MTAIAYVKPRLREVTCQFPRTSPRLTAKHPTDCNAISQSRARKKPGDAAKFHRSSHMRPGSTADPPPMRKCKTCRREKALEDFTYLVRGERRGIDRAATCTSCTTQNKRWKGMRMDSSKENIEEGMKKNAECSQEHLKVCSFHEFLALLKEKKNIVEMEGRHGVRVPPTINQECGHGARRKCADTVAQYIGKAMEYHFMYVIIYICITHSLSYILFSQLQ